ncbi:MAG: diacylglycerol kinase [Planctomycetota bacterium]|jgi:diacylglycerol kinase
MMDDGAPHLPKRPWRAKFRDAFRGVWVGVRRQRSFRVHLPVALAVIAAAAVLRIDDLTVWCVLLLCIAVVLAAEMFNSALESMAKAVADENNPHLRDALDIGSGAVLVAVAGAVTVGAIVFVHRLGILTGWWG